MTSAAYDMLSQWWLNAGPARPAFSQHLDNLPCVISPRRPQTTPCTTADYAGISTWSCLSAAGLRGSRSNMWLACRASHCHHLVTRGKTPDQLWHNVSRRRPGIDPESWGDLPLTPSASQLGDNHNLGSDVSVGDLWARWRVMDGCDDLNYHPLRAKGLLSSTGGNNCSYKHYNNHV